MDDLSNASMADTTWQFTTKPADNDSPSVAEVSPAAGEGDVSQFALVSVTFSEAMSSQSFSTANAVVLRDALSQLPVPGTISVPSANVLVFAPEGPLGRGRMYELELMGVEDLSGNPVSFQTSFTTIPNAPPEVLSSGFGPTASATDVALKSSIYIDLSAPVLTPAVGPITLTPASGGAPVAGEFVLLNDSTRMVFDPIESLAPFTSYEILVGPVADDGGQFVDYSRLPNPWTFTTGSAAFSLLSSATVTEAPGSYLTIEGSGFDPNAAGNGVTFTSASGSSAATVTRSTTNSVTVVVPDNAVSGPVTVTGASGSGVIDFNLYVAPVEFDAAVKRADTGDVPSDVEVGPDGALAVVTNSQSDNVFIIDVETREQWPVAVGRTPLKTTITPDGTRAYVTNFNSHSVSVIDLECAVTNGMSCVETIKVGFNPIGIDVSPDGSRIYVANYSSRSVSVIDALPSSGTYNRAVRTINTESTVSQVFTDPDGAIRRLASESNTSASEADPDGTFTRLKTDSNPSEVESHPDGTGIYIGTNFGVIATEVNLEVDQSLWAVTVLVTDSHESASDIQPDGGVTVMRTESSNSTSEVEPDGAGTIVRSESTVSSVESSPDGAIIHMVTGGGQLLIYAVPDDPFSQEYQAVTRTRTESASSQVETSPDGSLLYVTSFERGTVSVYAFGPGLSTDDSDPLQVAGTDFGLVLIEEIQVGSQPDGIAYSAVNDFAVVANSGSNTVQFISFTELPEVAIDDLDSGEDTDGDGILDIRAFIASTLADELAGATGDAEEQLEKALKHAEKNLDTKLWGAEARPSTSKGKKVFDNDKQIVKSLAKLVEDGAPQAAIALDLIELTIRLDREIAEDAIEAAQVAIADRVCPGDKSGKKCRKQLESAQKELDKAIDALADADAEIAEGDFDKAIDDFKKAWDHATKSQDDAAGKGFWEDEEDLPVEFALEQNYPNPFNPVTTVEFALPETAEVSLEVFDVLGRRVQTLVNGKMDAGYHSVQFNAERLASGIYLYRIQAGAYVKVHRMVLMK
jgi:YVTN family beta-propeller protein